MSQLVDFSKSPMAIVCHHRWIEPAARRSVTPPEGVAVVGRMALVWVTLVGQAAISPKFVMVGGIRRCVPQWIGIMVVR